MDCLVASFLAEAVILRERGVSSTLRPFDSITDASEYWIARFRGSEYISDLILRSAPLAHVSKDGRESLRCVHPSRRLLRKLLRMRSVSFTGSFASDDGWERDALISQTHVRDLAAQCARRVDESSAQRGRGERRMPVAPAASYALGSGRTHTSNNEYPGITRRSRTQWF